jgi:hypothetical protein
MGRLDSILSRAASGWKRPCFSGSPGCLLELHAQSSQEGFYVRPDGLEVRGGLNIQRDVQGIGDCAGELGQRPIHCADERGQSGDHAGGCGKRSLRFAQPFQGVCCANFDSLYAGDGFG